MAHTSRGGDPIHSPKRCDTLWSSTENFLLHTVAGNELDLLLCDFQEGGGGDKWRNRWSVLARCWIFFHPCNPPESTKSTDIFSLGSTYYTILTGYWLYRSLGPFKSLEEMEKYQELVDDLFASKRYPPVNGLEARVVIQRCWTGEYSDLSAPIAD